MGWEVETPPVACNDAKTTLNRGLFIYSRMEEKINAEAIEDEAKQEYEREYERTYSTTYKLTAETSDNLSVLFELDKMWSYLFAGEQRGVGTSKEWEEIQTLFELVQEKIGKAFTKTIIWNMWESRDEKGQTTEIDV